MTGWGYGATIGVLVKPMEKLSLGATFRTESTVKFKGEAQISNLSFLGIKDKTNLKREVSWPMWIAAGAAFTPEENLTLTADLQWTQWSKIDEIETNYIEIYWQIMMQQSGDDKMPMHWKNTLQIRFGAEYRMNTFAFRAGYYIDPSPSPDSTMNVLLPSYDFNVITAGFGYALDGLQLDFSLEYLMGKERSVGTDNEFNMPGIYNQKIIVPNISISYKF
jgi:long-chain fatty acid transport protein